MSELIGWVKEHPYLSGGVALALVVLYALYSSSSSSSAAAQSTAANATGLPDDTVQQAELAAGTQTALAQLATNTSIAQDQAAVNVQQLQSQQAVEQSNQQTQAALTLGLAQAGQSTSSILELLGAVNGNGAANTTQTVTSGNSPSTPGGGTATSTSGGSVSGSGASSTSTPVTTSTGQQVATPNLNPTPVMIQSPPSTATVDPGGTVYENDVTGIDNETGQTYGLNSQYYATPAAAQSLAQILGTSSGSVASDVGAVGGPFANPATQDIQVSQGAGNPYSGGSGAGYANAGQIIAGLEATPQSTWATQLAGYGFSLTGAEEQQIAAEF